MEVGNGGFPGISRRLIVPPACPLPRVVGRMDTTIQKVNMKKIALILVTASLAGLALAYPAHAIGIGGAGGEATMLKSRAQLMQWLATDTISERPYAPDYRCGEYSRDLIAAAQAAGFETWPVLVFWSGTESHEFVAFRTSTSIVWIEPQADVEYIVGFHNGQLCNTLGWCWPEQVAYSYYPESGLWIYDIDNGIDLYQVP